MDKARCLEVLRQIHLSNEYDSDDIDEVCHSIGITAESLYISDLDRVLCDEIDNDMLVDLVHWIRTGDKEPEADHIYIEYVIKLMDYRYEFYKRSLNPDSQRLYDYSDATRRFEITNYLERCDEEYNEHFKFEFNTNMPLEHNLKLLDDFKKNVEVIIRNINRIDRDDEAFIPTSFEQYSIRNYDKFKQLSLFNQWDRYLQVWDEVESVNESKRNATFYSRVGANIKEKFGKYKDYSPTDLRANIKKDYTKACQLIESAVEGIFPVLKPKEASWLGDI